MVVEFFDEATGELLYRAVIDGPGVLRIPPLSDQGARAVLAMTTYPNGRVVLAGPGREAVEFWNRESPAPG